MGKLFGGGDTPKVPDPEPIPPPPAPAPTVQQSADMKRARRLAAGMAASGGTIMTSPTGITQGGSSGGKTLLGA